MIADDFHDIADSLSILLQSMGHTVALAYDGKEALRLAQALQPEVVPLDIGMPDIDGYEVCRRIRAQPWGGEMLRVAQTGWGQEGDRRKSAEVGFDHQLVKPTDPTALVCISFPCAVGRPPDCCSPCPIKRVCAQCFCPPASCRQMPAWCLPWGWRWHRVSTQ